MTTRAPWHLPQDLMGWRAQPGQPAQAARRAAAWVWAVGMVAGVTTAVEATSPQPPAPGTAPVAPTGSSAPSTLAVPAPASIAVPAASAPVAAASAANPTPLPDQIAALRARSEALARRGEIGAALPLYHREHALQEALAESSLRDALAALQAQNDRVAKQGRIALLARNNALKAAELEADQNRQRLWALTAGLLLVTGLCVGWLYRRLQRLNGTLAARHAELRHLSEHDPLTGLANRRALDQRLGAAAPSEQGAPASEPVAPAVTAASPSGEPAPGWDGALFIVDIDHFKRVNDQHGHAAGDRVLQAVAARLRAAVRAEDLVVRWGGEEFLIHAATADHRWARDLATRLLAQVRQPPIAIDAEGHSVEVTVSVGWVCVASGDTRLAVGQAEQWADLALYAAKQAGRHRAVGVTGLPLADPQALREPPLDAHTLLADARVQTVVDEGEGAAPPA